MQRRVAPAENSRPQPLPGWAACRKVALSRRPWPAALLRRKRLTRRSDGTAPATLTRTGHTSQTHKTGDVLRDELNPHSHPQRINADAAQIGIEVVALR